MDGTAALFVFELADAESFFTNNFFIIIFFFLCFGA